MVTTFITFYIKEYPFLNIFHFQKHSIIAKERKHQFNNFEAFKVQIELSTQYEKHVSVIQAKPAAYSTAVYGKPRFAIRSKSDVLAKAAPGEMTPPSPGNLSCSFTTVRADRTRNAAVET